MDISSEKLTILGRKLQCMTQYVNEVKRALSQQNSTAIAVRFEVCEAALRRLTFLTFDWAARKVK